MGHGAIVFEGTPRDVREKRRDAQGMLESESVSEHRLFSTASAPIFFSRSAAAGTTS